MMQKKGRDDSVTACLSSLWPCSNSQMADRIRRFDWNGHALGLPANWPAPLCQLLDTFLETPLPMCIMWGEQALQLYNDAYAHLIGDQHPAALGNSATASWKQDWSLIADAWATARRGQAIQLHGVHLHIVGQGLAKETWLDLTFSPIAQDGNIAGVLLCIRDTTEQMLNDARLSQVAFHYRLSAHSHRLSEQRLQLALEASDLLGIWDWDLRVERTLPDINPLDLTLSELSQATQGFSRHGFIEHVHPIDRERIQQALDQSIQHSGTFAERYRINLPDGEQRWAFARGRCHYDKYGKPLRFPGAIMDITRQQESEEALRKREAELRELNETLESRIQERTSALAEVYERLLTEMAKREQAQEALRQSQKMEAVGQLTGGIAHDFNNMLTGIIGSLDLIQHYIRTGRHDNTQRFIEAAIISANRAAALTHRLLAFSRRQPLDLRRVNLNQLIESMHELLVRTLGAHIRIVIELQSKAWAVNSDENQLESALLNLVINARDAMPEGGTLHIATRNVELTCNRQVGELPPGNYVVLSISDTGCGMSSKVLASAFEPFFTTKPIGQGTGLGLSMIYGFMRQSGGHVQLESKSGVGTEISLYLPVHEGNISPEQSNEPIRTSIQVRQNENILVVEDDPAVRMLVIEVLQSLGYHVLEAAEGNAGLALLESAARIDLMITDVGLPGINGRQLAELGRQQRPGLRVLFMTGYAAQAASSGFLEPGMELLGKPFNVDTFIQYVHQALHIQLG